MTFHRSSGAFLLAAGLVLAAGPAFAQSYQAKLEAYNKAWRAHENVAGPYWASVTLNDYVLTQPPQYTGPPRPRDPDAPKDDKPRAKMPVVADFLRAAAEEFRFVPERPKTDIEFKRAYARIATAAGITREQAVRI